MLRVTDCQPGIRMRACDDLHKSGVLSGKRVVPVDPGYATLVVDRGEIACVRSGQTIETSLSNQANVWQFPSEFLLTTLRAGTRFENDIEGEVTLIWPLRIRASGLDEQHPLCAWASLGNADAGVNDKAMAQRLADELDNAFGALLGDAFASVAYQTGMEPYRCAEPLQGFSHNSEIVKLLRDRTGLILSDDLKVLNVRSGDADTAYAREKERAEAERKRREAVAGKVSEIAAVSTVEAAEAQARFAREQAELERQKLISEKETEIWRRQKQREMEDRKAQLEVERMRTESEIARDLESARVELAKAEARKREAEANKEQELAAKARAEAVLAARKMKDLDQERVLAESARLQLESLEQSLSAMRQELNRLETSGAAEPLALTARWRIHNRDGGIMDPCIGPAATCPSLTMLSVAVSVNRDAYVYILLQTDGEWVGLVPEWNDYGFGIGSENRMDGGRTVIWPGKNLRDPARPFWMLDTNPGVERLLVLASDEPIEKMRSLIDREGLSGLRRRAAPIGVRGIMNPAQSSVSTAVKPDAVAYQNVVTQLLGRGCVMQETVIHHV